MESHDDHLQRSKIWIVLNGELVNEFDMSQYTSAKTNPDGTAIPEWLSKPIKRTAFAWKYRLPGKACWRTYLFQEHYDQRTEINFSANEKH